MLFTASTLMRAVVVGVFGITTFAVPIFGVLAASTVGKVSPPSTDSEIFTFAVLIGAPLVPATFQVTVRPVFPPHETAVLGAVTENGPATTVGTTTVVAVEMAPAPARLSRAVTMNVIVRFVDGRTSPVRHVPVEHA